MINFTPAQQTVIASANKLVSWLFIVTSNGGTKYYWSTKDIIAESALMWAIGLSWQPGHYWKNGDDNREYTFKVVEFTGISMSRSSSESGIIAPNETSFTITNAGNVLDPDDFTNGTVLISLIISDGTNKEPIRRWLFDIISIEPQYQSIRFSCVDFLRKYLRGDYPGTKLISDLFPSNIPDKRSKTCVPVPFGTPYVPLKSIYKSDTIIVNSTTIAAVNSTGDVNCKFTDSALGFEDIEYGRVITVTGFTNPGNNGSFSILGSSSEGTIEISPFAGLVTEAEGPDVTISHGSRYYLLGSTDKTYTISKCHSPRDISQNLIWESTDAYSFTQSNRSDGTNNWRTFQPIIADPYESGSPRYPGFWKDGNRFLDMPCKFSRSDTASYTNPSSVLWWVLSEFGIPPKILRDSSFLSCKARYQIWDLEFNGAFTEKIGREQVLSSLLVQCHSTLLVDDGLTLSVLSKTSVKTLAKSDILKGSFSYSAISTDYFQDGAYVAWNTNDEPQDSPIKTLIPLGATSDRPSSEILNVPFVQDSQDVQRIGRLYFERKYLKKGNVSLGVKTSCLALNPNDIITINHADYGGTYDVLIDSVQISKDLNINLSCTRFSAALNDWEVLAPAAITIDIDDSENVWQPNPEGPGTTQVSELITTIDGHLVQGTNSITVTDLGGANRAISTKKPTFIVDSTVVNQAIDGDDYSVADWVNSAGGNENITIHLINLEGSVTTNYTFTSDYTIPSYVVLDMQSGARISIAAGVTVIIYSPANIIAQPNQQIFSGAGTVSFSVGGTGYAGWFGVSTSASDADNSSYITKLIAAFPVQSKIGWPPGIIQINSAIVHSTSGQTWFSLGGNGLQTNGTRLKQTVSSERVVSVTGSYNKYEDITFDANYNDNDGVLLGSGSGDHTFTTCRFVLCSASSASKASLNVVVLGVRLDHCLVMVNAGNGIYLAAGSNMFHMIGGSITTCATAGTANTAGIRAFSGYSQKLDNVAIEDCGNAGTATTGGVDIYAASNLELKIHCEDNLNWDVRTSGVAYNIRVANSYFRGPTSGTTFLFGSGARYITIHDCHSLDHASFISITSTERYFNVYDNRVEDTAYFAQTYFERSAQRDYSFKDITYLPLSKSNLIKYPPPSLPWAVVVGGASVWDHDSSVLFNDQPTIKMQRDGVNNCYGVYQIDISGTSNNWLRGKWVSFVVFAATSDATERNYSWYLNDSVTTVYRADGIAGASYAWTKNGASLYIDPSATYVKIIFAGIPSYNIYLGGIAMIVGMDFNSVIGPDPQNIEYHKTTAPTTGTWATGAIVWDSNAAAGAAPGWYCTAGGSPGTWKAMANLAA